jgi:hypothetical protein
MAMTMYVTLFIIDKLMMKQLHPLWRSPNTKKRQIIFLTSPFIKKVTQILLKLSNRPQVRKIDANLLTYNCANRSQGSKKITQICLKQRNRLKVRKIDAKCG